MKNKGILPLFRTRNTVFTFNDLSLILSETDEIRLRSKIKYYVKKGDLFRVRKGIYAKDRNYDRLDLATKIYTPAYISLETVLARAGIVFQYYKDIFVVSYLSRRIVCDNQGYVYKKLKNEALTNSAGVENAGNYYMATKERAFMDALYFYGDYHFDNLSPLEKEKCFALLPVYGNKKLAARLKTYFK